MKHTNTLIVYFSRLGQNYVSGKIVELEIGNTYRVANFIKESLNADMFEIKRIKPYADNYNDCTKEASLELKQGLKPEIQGDIDISKYENIFVGYPNWWGTYPMPVLAFLESHDFTGKRIYPFCTHEGSGIGHSVKDLQKSCPTAEIKQALAIRGSNVTSSGLTIAKWLENNGFKNNK